MSIVTLIEAVGTGRVNDPRRAAVEHRVTSSTEGVPVWGGRGRVCR